MAEAYPEQLDGALDVVPAGGTSGADEAVVVIGLTVFLSVIANGVTGGSLATRCGGTPAPQVRSRAAGGRQA